MHVNFANNLSNNIHALLYFFIVLGRKDIK